MLKVLLRRGQLMEQAGGEWRKGSAAITNEYVASLCVVDAHPQGPVQPSAKFRRTALRGIPFVVRDRWSTVVWPCPPRARNPGIVTGSRPQRVPTPPPDRPNDRCREGIGTASAPWRVADRLERVARNVWGWDTLYRDPRVGRALGADVPAERDARRRAAPAVALHPRSRRREVWRGRHLAKSCSSRRPPRIMSTRPPSSSTGATNVVPRGALAAQL
jgi:hypothetical protein